MANDNLGNRSNASGDAIGEGVGGLAGAATGAALGSLGGPIGTIIGGIAGAASGWWSGKEISHAAADFEGGEDTYRQDFAKRSTGSGSMSSGSMSTGSMSSGSATGAAASRTYDQARPAYQLGHVAGLNPDYSNRKFDDVEGDLRRGWEAQGSTNHKWDDVRDYARDAYTRGQERRLTLSEEQLSVGKRQVQAGEVNLHKTVETQHVQEQVGLMREEVTVERRPLTAADAQNLTIGEETIRVPLTREEAVVEKRVVPTEEVVVRTKEVTENQTVGADLRKERLVTEGLEQQTGLDAKTDVKGTKRL